MEGEFHSALERLNAAKFSGDNEEVTKTLRELEIKSVMAGEWPIGFFEGLVKFLKDPDFLQLKESWKIVYFINNNWERLSTQECELFRLILIAAFDKYADWMGAFLSSEILGERYADEKTLTIFADLGISARMPARAAVPHGLEYLARTTQSAQKLRYFNG